MRYLVAFLVHSTPAYPVAFASPAASANVFKVFRLPNSNKPVYIADGLSFLPPFLSSDFTIRRSSARETLCEILMTELGDSTHKSPYLIVSQIVFWTVFDLLMSLISFVRRMTI